MGKIELTEYEIYTDAVDGWPFLAEFVRAQQRGRLRFGELNGLDRTYPAPVNRPEHAAEQPARSRRHVVFPLGPVVYPCKCKKSRDDVTKRENKTAETFHVEAPVQNLFIQLHL